ncbi:MAG: hypothetical protein IT328_24070 [Caldilineaceae bacterium]|nr:hypothetical protein [Caldilineaceae bacterium]
MPNYAIVTQRMSSYGQAAALLPKLQQIYQQCQEVDDAITLYMSGTNADFVAAINSIFTPAERGELAAMLENVQLLVATWQAQHSVLLGGEPRA